MQDSLCECVSGRQGDLRGVFPRGTRQSVVGEFEAMRPAEPVATWADFSAAFRLHYIPEGLMDRQREEFCAFTQGKLSVDAYSREFGNLARYTTEEVSTDAKKQARFHKGLSPELRRDLRLHECTSFQALVNKAISAEIGHTDY